MTKAKSSHTFKVSVYRRGEASKTQLAEFEISAPSAEAALQEAWLQMFLSVAPVRRSKS